MRVGLILIFFEDSFQKVWIKLLEGDTELKINSKEEGNRDQKFPGWQQSWMSGLEMYGRVMALVAAGVAGTLRNLRAASGRGCRGLMWY